MCPTLELTYNCAFLFFFIYTYVMFTKFLYIRYAQLSHTFVSGGAHQENKTLCIHIIFGLIFLTFINAVIF